jgi:Tol biopolymer transport system component
MGPEGRQVGDLTDNEASGEFDPAWSPDGAMIAFASDRDGNPEIYVMAATGSHVTRLTNDPAHDWNPVWSPDGSRIAFESDRDGSVGLYLMDSDGTNVSMLIQKFPETCCPAWRPVTQGEAAT